jgi:hypothetical protein
MTALLIKRLVWGDGEQKDVLEKVVDEDVNTGDEDTDTDIVEEKDDGDETGEKDEEKDEDEDKEEEKDEEKDEDKEEEEEEEEEEEDETIEYNYSTFQLDLYKELKIIFTSPQFKILFNLYAGLVLLSISAATYNWFATNQNYVDIITTTNLPFCEKPFAITPYMAQGASAIAHLPYVPALFLGISYASPEMCPTLNPTCSEYANENRLFLWIQFALQLFTSVGGHMMPNPRAVLSQEISIALAFILLYNFFNLTTPYESKRLIDAKTVSMIIAMSVAGFLSVGLIPIIFVGFGTALSLEMIVPNAFGLLTPDARLALLYPFAACVGTLLIETAGCNWLMSNISSSCPWHVAFDILFWQVLASSVDVVILSPRPGRFITNE